MAKLSLDGNRKYQATDVWTSETFDFTCQISSELKPHQSVIMKVAL
jgi:hypothetical protein